MGASEPTPWLGQGPVSLDHILFCPVLMGTWDQGGPKPTSTTQRFHKCHLLLNGHFLKEKLCDKKLRICFSI